MTLSNDNIVIKETLYDSAVTRVQRGLYNKNSPVIIKTTAQDVPDESLVGQYSTSCLAQNKVDHPSVNKVIKEIEEGVGRTLILEDIGGITFKAWIDATKAKYPCWPLESPALFHSWMLRLLRWSIQLAEGISACHQQNIIHNDINPANVVVNPSTDQVQLIDFGAAFPDGSNIHEWTVVEQHRTLTYISPEQTGRLNRNIDYRSDYYALGATLYQLFSSQPPFVAHDLAELIHCHIARHPVPLDHVNPLIPESLSALVAKLMAKAPEDRYQNGRCLIQDLKSIEHALVCGIPFPISALGKNDVPEQLLIPAKLYGRERELETLRKAFNSHHDKPALIAVEGEAGGGKTTLITEAILHTVETPCQLLTGKSDAYNNKPHGALSQALAKSVGILLALPDDQFISWRLTLLEALNDNPHTLISLCPELMAVFETAGFSEKQPLYNADIQLKLHTSIYLQHLSSLDPVLLFIDDVQWCDGPSITLLEALINAKHPRITVMVTCRSEEVDVSHPYSVMKKTVEGNGIPSVIIALANLDVEQITQLLLATFHIEKKRLEELATILLKKTLGNPLFVHEFLKAAHQANHKTLYYDDHHGRWDWDVQQLQQISTSGNVAALLIDALHQQNSHTQDLLQWAACIGTRFNEDLLARITQTTTADIKMHLNAVYKQGYIHRIADQYGCYAFNHDRIRQTYYELLPRENVSQRHWVIGQVCGESDNQCGDDPLPHILAALRHELSPAMLCDEDTIEHVIDQFYAGALSAKEKMANNIALQYIQCAIRIAENMANESRVQLSSLILLQGELGYLVADFQLGADSFNRYRLMIHDVMLQATSFAKQAPLAYMHGDIVGSINYSLNCFSLLGVDAPDFDENIDLPLNVQRKRFDSLGGQKKVSELSTSDNFNTESISILQSTATNIQIILNSKAEYQWSEWFGLVGINDFLVSGFSRSTLKMLVVFNAARFSSGQYKPDNAVFEEIALILKQNDKLEGAGLAFGAMGNFYGRYRYSLSQCMSMLDYGKKISFEKGEYLPYLTCISNKIVVSFSAGVPLHDIQKLVAEFHDFLVSCGELVTAGKYYSKLLEQLINPVSENYLEIHRFTKIQWNCLLASAAFGAYHHLILQRYFWFGEYSCVVEHYKKEKMKLDKIKGMAPVDDNYFIYAISCFQSGLVSGDLFDDAIKNIEGVAGIYPPNFRHKWLLVQAEMCRLKNDVGATELYQKAAMDAKENGFIQMYALTHELHARYWQEQGRPDYTKYHIVKAMQGYLRWGCALKLENLYDEFGRLLDFQYSLERFSSISSVQASNYDISPVGVPNIQGQKALLKIANLISEALDIKCRLSQITEITVDNTGADQAVLLLNVDGDFQPKAIVRLSENGSRLSDVYDGSMTIPFELPKDLMSECVTSKKMVLLQTLNNKTLNNKNVNKDDVSSFQSQDIQSLLCYPIVYKGQCQSVLLLTHSTEENVFSRRDLQFLATLAPQFAVSIENARLYQERQQFNHALEQKVGQRTQELQAANDELQAFTAAVSHDLKAPLRAISGFTAMLSEDYTEDLGGTGKHYVNLLVSASKTMEQIIDGLLTLSRSTQTTLQWEEVNVSTLVEDKVRWLRIMEPAHTVVVNVQQGLTANGDLRLVRQVIDNLIENAWKYSHGVASPEISFGITMTKRREYAFYVCDNGVGFDRANADELFAPFRRFHQAEMFEGMGIGLATVYRIVKRHGGKVWAKSEPGHGATFYFQLNQAGLSRGEML